MLSRFASFIFCFALLHPSGRCLTNLTYRARFIEKFSSSFNNKFVALIKSGSDTDARLDSLLTLQKILNRSLKVYTSVLAVESLANYFGDSGKNLAPTTIFVHEDSTVRDLVSVLKPVDMARFTWLCEVSSDDWAGELEEVYLPFDSKFFAVRWRPAGGARFFEVYQIRKNSYRIVNYLGEWKPDGDLEDVTVPERKTDFGGAKFRYLVKNKKPSCSRDSIKEHPFGVFECLNQLLWIELQNRFNYTTEYMSVNFSGPNPKSLMMEMIKVGEADSGVLSAVLSSDRKLSNRFLWPLYQSRMYLITRLSYAEVNFTSFLKPFSSSFWFALAAWLTVIGLILAASQFTVVRSVRGENRNFGNEYFSMFLMPFRAMCSQSCTLNTGYVSIRTILLMAYIVPVFCLTAYSGGLISSLARPRTIPFENLKEFEEAATHKLAVVRFSYLDHLLKTDDFFASLRQKSLVSNNMPKDYSEAYTQICGGKVTFITELPIISYDVLKCSTFMMDETLGTLFASMVVSPHFPFLEVMNRHIQKRTIAGIRLKSIQKESIDKLQLKLNLKDSNWVYDVDVQNLEALSVQNLLLLFMILLFGIMLSIFFLLVELCHWKYTKM
ncbi:UNVERIFIED_CONTAM: hypothetical protein PYX00_004105 [Menopon gallinae]|uniref:Ionotropic receptor n=1 Tax=Menopon gallinae TaxID=328185 RepID=A0AAW2I2Z6_9NEOP